MKRLKEKIRVATRKQLPARYKSRIKSTIQQEKHSYSEKHLAVQKDVLDGVMDISEQVAKGEVREIIFSVISFILDFFEILFEEHPQWFKTRESQEKAIELIEDISSGFSAIGKAFSDKSRELFEWKTFITPALAQDYKGLTKKRISLISTIFGIVCVIVKTNPFTSIFNAIAFALLGYFLAAYVLLYLANDGDILIHIYKEHLTSIKLTLYDYYSVIAYFFIEDIDKKRAKKIGKRQRANPPSKVVNVYVPRVIYEYKFPKGTNKPKALEVHRKFRNFHGRKF